MEKYRVFLTDDHQLIIDGLQSLLAQSEQFEVIGSAADGREALRKVPVFKPDLVIMDLDMPGLNGIETTRALKTDLPELRIVILTMHLEKGLVSTLKEAGADGYMVKDTSQQEFLHGLRLVMEEGSYYSVSVTESLLEKGDKDEGRSALTTRLSEREREVLQQLIEGYSSKEISTNLHIGMETVNTHRKSLLRKLEARNVAHLVKIALQSGLVR